VGRIRVLPDQVANKIAAGEVVERPASVVKELLENSLDAGATEIRIEIEGGGRRLMRVSDNGCGMLRDDALLAFERHATSKLRDVQDLLSIATLGFRGEALPSIASVSRLSLETRAQEETTGTRIEIEGGKMLRCEETAFTSGASIAVRDLFFNVPARKKFLRSEQTELAHIASLVTHYSLAHPDKSFYLASGKNELLNVTPVESLADRVYQVFGGRTLEELVDLGIQERELFLEAPAAKPAQAIAQFRAEPEDPASKLFSLTGFLSRPQVQKSNRNSIFTFVNGRLVRDKLLLHAISSAYYNLMPPSAFPFALLFLDCDPHEVDVNVHPSKTEVRFRHQSFIHDFVRDTLRGRLMETRPAPAFSPSPASRAEPPAAERVQRAAALPYSEFSQMMENEAHAEPAAMMSAAGPDSALPEFVLPPARPPSPALDPRSPGIAQPGSQAVPSPRPYAASAAAAAVIPAETHRVKLRAPDTHGAFPAGLVSETAASLSGLSDLRPLGQLHESFIIAAGRDGLWIIDQHVAHERVLFEKVLRERAAGKIEVQRLLLPLVIELTHGQQIEYARIAGELEATGFETEPFGNRTLAIKAAPAAIASSDLEKVLLEILETAEGELRGLGMEDIRRGIAASISCRAAIKINTRLEPDKMDWLLRALAATEYPMSCPHGRPIALRYSMREILKAFQRI
jgi:DNA mismatch repair protein MutL